MIPLKVHNVLDYVIGAVLILTPYLFGFSDVDAGRNVFGVLGVALIVYSLFTNYRYSIARVIPLGVHMAMDVASGTVVMLAPTIFGYRGLLTGGQYAVHFILGLGAVALVAFTDRKTDRVVRTTSTYDRDHIDINRAA